MSVMSCCVLLFVLSVVSVVNSDKKTVSLVELSKCQEFKTFGYGYKKYFKIDDIHHMRKTDEIVNLRIAILAAKDAHILLSPNDSPELFDPVYEIVLGAGSNTFCEIRRKMRLSSLKTKRILNVLSAVDPTAMNIVLKSDGMIEVRYEGDEEPIISGKDDDVLPIKYISFSSWGMTEAKFFYDCPNELSDQLTVAKEDLNMQTALEMDLFSSYDMLISPENLAKIEVLLEPKNAQYDSLKQIMTTRLALTLSWFDPKLVWDPENYDTIDTIRYSQQHKIWQPILQFIDGFGLNNLDSSAVPFKVIIYSNGNVTTQTMDFTLETWCSMGDVQAWPHDRVTCPIKVNVFNAEVPLLLSKILDRGGLQVAPSGNSQWEIISIKARGESEKTVLYKVDLKRNDGFLSNIYGTGLHVTIVFLILSTFISESKYRLILILMTTVIVCVLMMSLNNNVPPSYLPAIMCYYQANLVLCWVALFCHVVRAVISCNPPSITPPEWIQSLFHHSVVRAVLCLQKVEPYNKLQAEQSPWMLVTNFIDQLFVIQMMVFHMVVLIKGY